MQHLQQALLEIQILEARISALQSDISNKEAILQQMRKSNKRVVFDEATIAEHDKERGTRMKIDEPKTPFVREEPFSFPDAGEPDDIPILSNPVTLAHPPVDQFELAEQSEPEDSETVEVPIATIAVPTDFIPPRAPGELPRPQMLDLNRLTESLDTVKQKQDFASARSKHYNEYERLKLWREKHKKPIDEEEEDDDEEEEDEES